MLAALVDHHIRPMPAASYVKTYLTFHHFPSALAVGRSYPALRVHPAAVSFRIVAAASDAPHMVSFLAHHRMEAIGGGPCRADPATLGVVDDEDVVGAAVGGDVVAGAPRAREAD